MPDIVRVGGAELVRTREANGEFTYRPVDASGAVVDAAAFEARKKAERAAKLANDPRVAERAACLLYTSPSPRDAHESRMPSSA